MAAVGRTLPLASDPGFARAVPAEETAAIVIGVVRGEGGMAGAARVAIVQKAFPLAGWSLRIPPDTLLES